MVLGENGMKGGRRGPRAWFAELGRLLGGELTEIPTLRERGLGISPVRLSACIIILAMSYGVCMGAFAVFGVRGPSPLQVVASMIKVPLLFYLTLLVTLPSLYVFNALVGSRLSLVGVLRLLIASLGVNVTVLASLGPIVAFFSVCTTSYPFMVLLNVVVFAIAGLFGLRFLLQTLHRLNVAASARPPDVSSSSETWAEAEPAGPLEPVRDRAVPGAGPDRLPDLGHRLRAGRGADGLGAAAVHRQSEPTVHLVPGPRVELLHGGRPGAELFS